MAARSAVDSCRRSSDGQGEPCHPLSGCFRGSSFRIGRTTQQNRPSLRLVELDRTATLFCWLPHFPLLRHYQLLLPSRVSMGILLSFDFEPLLRFVVNLAVPFTHGLVQVVLHLRRQREETWAAE